MEDRDYIALCQIQKSLKNEISSLSMSNGRFLDYLSMMESSKMGINGALKALDMLADLEDRSGNETARQACLIWMDRIMEASSRPGRREIFQNIDFSNAPEKEFDRSLLNPSLSIQQNRHDWMAVLLLACLCGLLMAVLVLLAQMNYWAALVLCSLIYLFLLAWYFAVDSKRQEVSRLAALRHTVRGESGSFLQHFRLRQYPVPFWKRS